MLADLGDIATWIFELLLDGGVGRLVDAVDLVGDFLAFLLNRAFGFLLIVLCAEEFRVDPIDWRRTVGAKPCTGSVTVSDPVPREITVRPHFCAVAKL